MGRESPPQRHRLYLVEANVLKVVKNICFFYDTTGSTLMVIMDIVPLCIVEAVSRTFYDAIELSIFFAIHASGLTAGADGTFMAIDDALLLRKCHHAHGGTEHDKSQYQAQGSFHFTSHCFPTFLPLWGTVGWADNRILSSQMAL